MGGNSAEIRIWLLSWQDKAQDGGSDGVEKLATQPTFEPCSERNSRTSTLKQPAPQSSIYVTGVQWFTIFQVKVQKFPIRVTSDSAFAFLSLHYTLHTNPLFTELPKLHTARYTKQKLLLLTNLTNGKHITLHRDINCCFSYSVTQTPFPRNSYICYKH
jgi:hypothetical protein